MSTGPWTLPGLFIRGKFRFKANFPGLTEIDDQYTIKMIFPPNFPHDLPKVEEVGGEIPRDGNYHVNPDGTLCLGSPLRLLKKINVCKSMVGFAEKCLIPYLYAVSYKRSNGGDFIFGELDHGNPGIIKDYSVMFGLKEKDQIKKALHLLGIRKRLANKYPCPCGCGRRLGVCSLHDKLNEYRKMAPVSWFRGQRLI